MTKTLAVAGAALSLIGAVLLALSGEYTFGMLLAALALWAIATGVPESRGNDRASGHRPGSGSAGPLESRTDQENRR